MNIRARLVFLAAGLVLILAVGSFLGLRPRGGPHPAAAQSPLDWHACAGSFQCATLEVPLDYGNPASRQISLALVRRPARDPAHRIGSILVNPGGPGAPGIGFAESLATAFPAEIQDRFDIVGFDPRGVGQSTPLLCHDNIQQLAALEPEPTTDAQWTSVIDATRDFVALCAQRGGDMLPHLGSVDVVRDMDRIRQALGDDRLTYVGFSYGTLLGELYADRFPDRVRALVLDGPIDPAVSADEATAVQAIGFERALSGFVADCRARSCSLAANGADPWDAINGVIEQARAHPIPSSKADRPAGPGEIVIGMFQALYRPGTWRVLERAVTEAQAGDGSTFIHLADSYLGRLADGGYANEMEMNAAVNCLDNQSSRDLAHYRVLSDEIAKVAPRLGRAMAPGGLVCALWPVDPQPVALGDGVQHAPPVVIIGTTNDPATPFEWALGARHEMPTSVLLTHEGDGHTIYLSGSTCIDNTVDRYLLTLATPQDGSICGNNADPPRPAATPPSARIPTPVLPAEAPAAAAVVPTAPGAPDSGAPPAAVVPAEPSGTAAAFAPRVGASDVTPSPTQPPANRTSTHDRGAEAATALRVLAVVVLASLIALVVATRRRLMRF